MTKEDIDRCFDRLTSSGDLQVLYLIITDARALVERELLQKLAGFPVGSSDDISAFAYRQGWLRALHQMQALFQPEAAAQRGRGPTAQEIAFDVEELLR
jgi:hypothetical protein